MAAPRPAIPKRPPKKSPMDELGELFGPQVKATIAGITSGGKELVQDVQVVYGKAKKGLAKLREFTKR